LPQRLLLCKVNAIPGKYFIRLTIFGSIADKMTKMEYLGIGIQIISHVNKKKPELSPAFS